jgi:cytochrome c oxidase subunit II
VTAGGRRFGALSAFVLAGCDYRRGALDAASPQALLVDLLFWVFFWISVLVLVCVLVALSLAVLRARARRMREGDAAELEPEPSLERRARRAVLASTVFSLIVLVGLLIASVVTGRELFRPNEAPRFHVKLVGHQWWWEVQYLGPRPDQLVSTANELYLPAGIPVEVELRSVDVIHSLWIPNLHGKRDLIPGHTSRIVLLADRVGRFEGHCAEFCGLQHARMQLVVRVETPEHFSEWLERQRRPAVAPVEASARRGAEVFQRSPCVLCHSITGTDASASAGPDLTHVGSREWLGAGALRNSPESMRLWLTDPQRAKPGVQMPPTALPDHELFELVAYLRSLQ